MQSNYLQMSFRKGHISMNSIFVSDNLVVWYAVMIFVHLWSLHIYLKMLYRESKLQELLNEIMRKMCNEVCKQGAYFRIIKNVSGNKEVSLFCLYSHYKKNFPKESNGPIYVNRVWEVFKNILLKNQQNPVFIR